MKILKLLRNVMMVLAFLAVGVAAIYIGSPQTANAACSALPTDRGTATTTVNIPSDGTYRVWSRILAPSSSDNSFFLQIDDKYCNVVVGDATIPTGSYTWVDYKSGNKSNKINVDLSAGNHTIKVAGREDNVRLDKIIFVSNMSCVPSGDGSNCDDSGSSDPGSPGSVSFDGVNQGQTVSGSVPIEASVNSLSNVTKVEFFIDGKADRSEVNPPYCLAVSPSPTTCSGWDSRKVSNGNHTVKAVAHHSGGTTESSVTFKVQNDGSSPPPEEDPVQEVELPPDNNDEPVPVEGTVILQPESIDGDTDRIEYYVDGDLVEDGILDTTKLPDGEHEVEVRQYKSDGSVETEKSTILVDNEKTILERLTAAATANPPLTGAIAVAVVALASVGGYLYINRYPVGPKLSQRIRSLFGKGGDPHGGSGDSGGSTVIRPQG